MPVQVEFRIAGWPTENVVQCFLLDACTVLEALALDMLRDTATSGS
jgi:hypothetical protein